MTLRRHLVKRRAGGSLSCRGVGGLDLPGDFEGQVQRALGGGAADFGRLMRLNAVDEIAQFQLERLVLLDGHRFAHDLFAGKLAHDGGVLAAQQLFQQGRLLLAFARHAVDESFLRAVIQRDVAGDCAAAENADLAHALRADAAGGQIGHAAVGKAQPRVGDVLRLAQDGDAHRVHARDGRPHKSQNHVQIVNHQVEHDADVRAAGRVGGKAVGFNEARIGGHVFQVMEDGIEALDVADLEDDILLRGPLHQPGGLGGIVGHRFFHQHMFAGGQEGVSQLEMGAGGGDDAESGRTGHGLTQGGKNRHAIFFGDFGGGLRGGIMHAGKLDQPGGGQIGVDAGMFLAQGTDPQDGHFKLG